VEKKRLASAKAVDAGRVLSRKAVAALAEIAVRTEKEPTSLTASRNLSIVVLFTASNMMLNHSRVNRIKEHAAVFGMQLPHEELSSSLPSLISTTSLTSYHKRNLLTPEMGSVAHVYHSMETTQSLV